MTFPAKNSLNWTIIIFFIATTLIAITGSILLCVFGIVRWPTWIFAGSYLMLTGLAITAGYHRLFAHKSYKAAWPIRFLMLWFGAASFQGSVLEWSTDHRNHHRYTDTDKDPYSIKKGFWFAHMGWLFKLNTDNRDFSNVEDLQQDILIRLQHKYFVLLAILSGFIFPMAIAWLWGDPWGGLIIAGTLRMTLNHQFTFMINSVCHYFGNHTYSDKQTARDNWITALFTYGEGFHNFHHQFPLDYRNGIRAYHYDPAKWLIRGLTYLGLASDLKRVSEHRIIRYRVQMEEQRLLQTPSSILDHFKQTLEPVNASIHQLLAHLETLEKEYVSIRLQKMHQKMGEYRKNIRLYKRKLKTAQQELETYLAIWAKVISNCRQLSTEVN